MAGWKTTNYPVEGRCRGYLGLLTTCLLRDVRVNGGNPKKATKELAEEAEKGSFWLWLKRKDKCWGKNNQPQKQPQGGTPISCRG